MTTSNTAPSADPIALDHEMIVIGAGVCGIYQLYRLTQLGVDATLLEAGGDVGGTWYWNRYPGARFDSESYTYGYSFSKELLQEWSWSEHFAAQPETERYLQHVTDRFDLRRHMQFNCRVQAARYHEDTRHWTVQLQDGRSLTCRFLLMAVGLLSAPTPPRYPGMDSFEGLSFHTYHWPAEPVELAGKRVAVIGTGATGVQIIGEIADKVASLTVFQRRPNWCAPLHNAPITEAEQARIKASYDEIFELCRQSPGGFVHRPDRRKVFDVSEQERLAFWEQLYASPGFGVWIGNFRDVSMDEAANAEFSAFVADKIRQRVHDPAVAELLIPTDHGFGTRRVPLETRYYEAYNRDNVELVSLEATPIERITPQGLRTTERDFEFDLIVYATGFDAITGAFDRIDITGVGGQTLRQKWADGPVTFLGLASHGFPNLIALSGPTSGSVSANIPRGIEETVDWVTALLVAAREQGATRIEAQPEAEQEWTAHVRDMYEMLLLSKARSWFTGYNTNVDGLDKPRYLLYNGGAPRYRRRLAEVKDQGYAGFELR